MTEEYEALVYDLDGTLVRLEVDWDRVTREAGAVLSARGIDTEGMGLWEVLERAETAGLRPAVERRIAEQERAGARSATRLALADELPAGVPVAVCSLNCEAACRIALELHGLDAHVGAVVGRDSVASAKPDPEPLLAAIERVSAEPGRTLFIGDTETDERTAARAGVAFQYASDRLEE